MMFTFNYYVTAIKSRYPPYFDGTCMNPSLCTGAILNNLCEGSNKFCVPETSAPGQNGLFNFVEVIQVAPNNQRIQSIFQYIIAPSNGMDCSQKAAYLAQLAHESTGFMNGEEIGVESYFDRYENRADLGNTNPGDGRKYRGRGFIQLTGRSNYALASSELNIDLINNPELAAFPSVAGKIAAWYWRKKNLNAFSDGSFYSFSKQTQIINGRLNGLDDRTLKLEKLFLKLNCGKIVRGHGNQCISKVNGVGYCKPMCVKGLERKDYCGCIGKIESGLCPNDPENVKCCFEKCAGKLDLLFLLDSSGSIYSGDFLRAKQFVYDVVNQLDIGYNETRVAIINFSSMIQVEAYLNSYFDKANLLRAIQNIYQFGEFTNTGEALERCLDIYDETNGMRPSADGVIKLIIVLTDGLSNGYINPIDSALQLKSKDISIFSVGVGSGVNFDELNGIASDNNVFLLDNYNAALKAIEDIKQSYCREPAVIPEITNLIDVEKDSYKYFAYSLSLFESETIYLYVTSTVGNVKVFFSFDIKNPNDLVLDSVDALKKKRDVSSVQEFSIPRLDLNSTKLYVGIKGLSELNVFKIEISNVSQIVPGRCRTKNLQGN